MITFSSCFYIIKSKNQANIYIQWMKYLISIVNNFYLVIYTDANTNKYINTLNNTNIKIIIKPLTDFYNYKYKNNWIQNHINNTLLNSCSSWELNMLWSEKIWFVNETIQNKYFDTEFYGWCDIGYFRNRNNDLNTSLLSKWPNYNIITNINKDKIIYGCVNNNDNYINYLYKIINNKNKYNLPNINIPLDQVSIAGGFFIIHKDKINWWSYIYDTKLQLYFNHKYVVKDDQLIIIDCIFSNINHFQLYRENTKYDNWFMFQRILN